MSECIEDSCESLRADCSLLTDCSLSDCKRSLLCRLRVDSHAAVDRLLKSSLLVDYPTPPVTLSRVGGVECRRGVRPCSDRTTPREGGCSDLARTPTTALAGQSTSRMGLGRTVALVLRTYVRLECDSVLPSPMRLRAVDLQSDLTRRVTDLRGGAARPSPLAPQQVGPQPTCGRLRPNGTLRAPSRPVLRTDLAQSATRWHPVHRMVLRSAGVQNP